MQLLCSQELLLDGNQKFLTESNQSDDPIFTQKLPLLSFVSQSSEYLMQWLTLQQIKSHYLEKTGIICESKLLTYVITNFITRI